MKKIISVMLSVVMMVCALSVTSVTAMAAFVGSIETTTKEFNADVTVNGSPSVDGKYEIVDPTEDVEYDVKVEFTYSGDEPLQYWEIPGLQEGVDYVIISNENNKLVVGIINDDVNYIKANAVTAIDDAKTTTVPATVNKSRKSPKTGAGFAAAAVGAATAGMAVACASKKRGK